MHASSDPPPTSSRRRRPGPPLAAALLLAACAPPLAGEPEIDLATSSTTGADAGDDAPGSAGISTVTGQSGAGTETGGDDGGDGPAADAPPTITAFTVDGVAGEATVELARAATLAVIAADDRAIARVRIVDGDAALATLSGPDFTFSWVIDDVVAAAPRTLVAIAEDDAGQASAPVELAVDFALPPTGSPRWEDPGSPLYAGEVRGLARDGDAVIAVGVRGLDPESDETHALLRIYDAETGDVMISAAHPKPGSHATYRANAVALAPTGEIAVAGAGTPPGDATPRPWVAVFGPSGALLRERLESTAGGEALAIAAGDDGLFVAGQGVDGRHFLRRLGHDLAEVWARGDDDPTHTTSEIRGLVRGDDGDLYVAGTVVGAAIPARVYAGRYSPDGDERWGGRVDCEGIESDHGRAIALGEGGDVLITAAMVTEGGLRIELRWLDAATGGHRSASLLPSALTEGDELPGAVAVDRHGRVTLGATLSSATGSDAIVYKRSSDGGAAIWEETLDGADHGDDRGLALAVGDDGVIVIGGSQRAGGWSRWWVQALEP